MPIKDNDVFVSQTGTINISKATYAEIIAFKQEGTTVKASILLRIMGEPTPYRDFIDINDIQILEDYFIDNNIRYFIINRN